MDERAVINASPLIFLTRASRLSLLTHFARQLIVPQAVADEILRRGPADAAARTLQTPSLVAIAPSVEIPPAIAHWGLGWGESAVLALARSMSGAIAVMDDLAGRRCAATLGIPVRGTLGIVLAANQRGLVPAARPVLEELIRGGMYLSRPVLDEALRRVGE